MDDGLNILRSWSIPPRATKLNNAPLCAGHYLLAWARGEGIAVGIN